MDIKKLLDECFKSELDRLNYINGLNKSETLFSIDKFKGNLSSYVRKLKNKTNKFNEDKKQVNDNYGAHLITEVVYNIAVDDFNKKHYYEAYLNFKSLKDFNDSEDYYNKCIDKLEVKYQKAVDLYKQKKYKEAKAICDKIIGYSNCANISRNCNEFIKIENERIKKEKELERQREKERLEQERLEQERLNLIRKQKPRNIIFIALSIILLLGTGYFGYRLFSAYGTSLIDDNLLYSCLWALALVFSLSLLISTLIAKRKLKSTKYIFSKTLISTFIASLILSEGYFTKYVLDYGLSNLFANNLRLLYLWLLSISFLLGFFIFLIIIKRKRNIIKAISYLLCLPISISASIFSYYVFRYYYDTLLTTNLKILIYYELSISVMFILMLGHISYNKTEKISCALVMGMVVPSFLLAVTLGIAIFKNYSWYDLRHSNISLLVYWCLVLWGALVFINMYDTLAKNKPLVKILRKALSIAFVFSYTIFTIYIYNNNTGQSLIYDKFWLFTLWLLATTLLILWFLFGLAHKWEGDISGYVVLTIIFLALFGEVTFSIYMFSRYGTVLFSDKLWLFFLWLGSLILLVSLVIGGVNGGRYVYVVPLSVILLIGEVVFSIVVFKYHKGSIFGESLWLFFLWILTIPIILGLVYCIYAYDDWSEFAENFFTGFGIILLVSPIILDIIIGIVIFTNKTGISLYTSAVDKGSFGGWIFGWILLTILSIALIVCLVIAANDGEGGYSIASVIIAIVLLALLCPIGFVRASRVDRIKNSYNQISLEVTYKEDSTHSSYYSSKIGFTITNDSDYDFSEITGTMKFYDKYGNEVSSWTVNFNGISYSHTTLDTYVSFDSTSNALYNLSYDDLSITFKVTLVAYNTDIYNPVEVDGNLMYLDKK